MNEILRILRSANLDTPKNRRSAREIWTFGFHIFVSFHQTDHSMGRNKQNTGRQIDGGITFYCELVKETVGTYPAKSLPLRVLLAT